MRGFLLSRLAETMVALVSVLLVVFLMLHAVPGDPVRAMFGEYGASPEQVETLRRQLGLDLPIWQQFVKYVSRLVVGDLGVSFKMNTPVREALAVQLPHTINLALTGILIAILMGIFLGVLAALHQNTWVDTLCMMVALIGVSLPSFWLGLLMIFVFSYLLEWLPAVGHEGWKSLIMPSLTLGLWAAGSLARLVRSAMLEVLRQEYVRTARAKGLAEQTVIYKHALKNAMIPVITMIGLLFGNALSGAVIVESVFARPGIGRILVTSIVSKDFPMVQGTVLVIAVVFLLANLAVDLSYGVIDPRVKVAD